MQLKHFKMHKKTSHDENLKQAQQLKPESLRYFNKINKREFAVEFQSKKWLVIHCFQIELEFRDAGFFVVGGKQEKPEKNP